MKHLFLIVALAALASSGVQAANWRGGMSGLGEAMQDTGRAMMESALQEERQRRVIQFQYEQERQMMESRLAAERVYLEQQGRVQSIVSMLQQMILERDKQIQQQSKQIVELVENQKKLLPLVEELRVYRKYPTWAQTVRTKEFEGWLKRQPPDVQALSESDRADDAIRMLSAYHAEPRRKK